MGAYETFVTTLREELGRRKLSIRGAASHAGIPVRSVQSVLEGHIPSIERAAQIAVAFGWEFYIGPPRAASKDAAQQLSFELRELRDEFARHNAASETVLREILRAAGQVIVKDPRWESGRIGIERGSQDPGTP